jgi:hypothetical protein
LENIRNAHKIVAGEPKEKVHLCVDERIILKITLKWVLRKHGGRVCIGFIWDRIRDRQHAHMNTVINLQSNIRQ